MSGLFDLQSYRDDDDDDSNPEPIPALSQKPAAVEPTNTFSLPTKVISLNVQSAPLVQYKVRKRSLMFTVFDAENN